MRGLKGRKRSSLGGMLSACFAALISLWPCPSSFWDRGAGVKAETLGDEYSVKGAYLLNFAKFTTWRVPPPRTNESVFTICTWKSDPLKRVAAALESKSVLHLAVKTKIASSPDHISECDILFVPAGESMEIPRIVTVADSSGTLLVAEDGEGAMITFTSSANGQIRFSCNLTAAEKAGIKFSSQLISLAVRVEGEGAP